MERLLVHAVLTSSRGRPLAGCGSSCRRDRFRCLPDVMRIIEIKIEIGGSSQAARKKRKKLLRLQNGTGLDRRKLI
jgi:hypothetical protein